MRLALSGEERKKESFNNILSSLLAHLLKNSKKQIPQLNSPNLTFKGHQA